MNLDLYNFIENIVNSNVVAGIGAALTATITASWQYHKQKTFNDIEETFNSITGTNFNFKFISGLSQ
jgi:hypothetical protein